MKKIGDRKDGTLLRDLDSIHILMNNIYPRRTENEASMQEIVDLSAMNEYLKKKNLNNENSKYTMFQFVLSVMAKTLVLRPQLNYFIANKKAYKRNYYSVAFTIKKKFMDSADEGLAIVRFNEEDNIDSMHNYLEAKISGVRNDADNKGNNNLDFVQRMPKFVLKIVFPFVRFLDKHGKLPNSIMKDDPNYSSLFVTNLGSIGLNSAYHHLNEWGTNSVFCVIGKKKIRPFYNEDGSYSMKDSLELGLIVDERIADGYYYAKSIKLAKYLFENPEELDKPFSNVVNYE